MSRIHLSFLQNFSKKDNRWQKSFVVFIYCLDTVHQVMLVQYIYVYLVTEFGNFFFLLGVDKCVRSLNLIKRNSVLNFFRHRNTEIITVNSALLEAMVQMLFVSRVWRCKLPLSTS